MTTSIHLRDGERGFTLVELLVGVTIAMIVLLATLQSLDMFTKNAATQTRVTDANSQVRTTMDRTVDDLRGASSIVKAAATDLVYAVPINATDTRLERLCVESGYLYGTSTTVTGSTLTAPTAACSTGTMIGTLRSTTSTAFTYDGASTSATPAKVKNVGLTVSLDASGPNTTATSTLQASAARRSAGTLPLPEGDGTVDTVCNASGALLSLSATVTGRFAPLTVTYANTGGISLGTPTGTTLQIPEGITTVVATITDAAGATATVRKDVECNGS
ncbi:MAG: prepilin-type N-terminal cleavage/methylation domain-containing protein [Solirubrobacteraceae bacterium]